MKSAGASKIGLVRKNNEDRFYINERFFIVADGMGGHEGGEIASTIAIDDISSHILSEVTVTTETLRNAIEKTNKEILLKVGKNPELEGMGTTSVIAYVDTDKILWANVGDSRLYIYRDEELIQITKDHSYVQTLVDSGEISREDKLTHPHKNYLTRAVGVDEDLRIDTGEIELRNKDRILVCSDGLSAYVSETVIGNILALESDDMQAVEALIASVYEVGARDNVTVIVATL